MKYLQQWFLPGLFAEGPISLERAHNIYVPPTSIAFFDRFTGEIWARRIVTDSEGQVTRWMVYNIEERTHGQLMYYPAGSILSPVFWHGDVAQVPLELLAREFLLWYDWAMNK